MVTVVPVRGGWRRLAAGSLVALAVGAASASAQAVSVRSYLDRTAVGRNQAFVLSVEIAGAQQVQGEPRLPDLSAFAAFLSSGSSRQVQIVNGRTTVSVTLQYRYQATAAGTFEIGPVQVTVDGETYASQPLTIEITDAPPPAGAGGAGAGAAGGGDVVAPDDLFIRALPSKRRVYQNEPVAIDYKIYTRVSVGSYGITRPPATAGFWTEEVPLPSSPAVTNEVLNGREYATATIKRLVVFPTGAGRQTVTPMTVEAQVRVRRRALDPFDDFFSGSLLGRNVPTLVTSDAVEIEVLPLPAAGRPADFSGLVGDVGITASLDQAAVETNEALTLSVRIEGDGNLRTLAAPEIAFPADFEVYPPEVSEQIDVGTGGMNGWKAFEYVLVPRAPGRRTIPPIGLAFFDPARGGYASASTPPLEVEVAGDPVGAPVVARRGRGEIETLREDIRFIHVGEPRLRARDRSPLGPLAWVVALVPLAAVAGAWGVRRHRDRLEGDVAYARHRRAGSLARKRLRTARTLAGGGSPKAFYAEVAGALQGFLGDKLNVSEAGFVRDDVRRRLEERGVSDAAIAACFECVDACDRQRFAPSAASPEEMQAFVERVERVMSDLDEVLG